MRKPLLSASTLVLLMALACFAQETKAEASNQSPRIAPRIETSYDRHKNKTTVRLAPVQISGAKDKYHSLHLVLSFSYPGQIPPKPEVIDFELQTVVKTKLKIDLYVVFVVDGETIFLSSNRWAVRNPVPGKRWRGERLVFRMPYETLLKITKAREFAIKMDGVIFEVGESQRQALYDFATNLDPE